MPRRTCFLPSVHSIFDMTKGVFMSIIYRELLNDELKPELFASFNRFQQVKKCWRKVDGIWVLKDIAFIDNWDGADHIRVCGQLRDVLNSGGRAFGAFVDGQLKGFSSVNGRLIGSQSQYAVLEEMHVSLDIRRMGLGKKLFGMAAEFARGLGAKKLYISAMSAQESMAFYHSLGCTEALEYHQYHVDKEPCDCQMEYAL